MNVELELKEAIENEDIIVIHGAGGTGKTYLATKVAQLFSNVCFASFTNRAVSNLKKATGNSSEFTYLTIHQLLGSLPVTKVDVAGEVEVKFNFPKTSPEFQKHSIFIIDEFSLIDSNLLTRILTEYKSLRERSDAKLVFVGDHMQLIPIGETEIPLMKIIDSPSIHKIKLEKIMRCRNEKMQKMYTTLLKYVKLEEKGKQISKGKFIDDLVTNGVERIETPELFIDKYVECLTKFLENKGDFPAMTAHKNVTCDCNNYEILKRIRSSNFVEKFPDINSFKFNPLFRPGDVITFSISILTEAEETLHSDIYRVIFAGDNYAIPNPFNDILKTYNQQLLTNQQSTFPNFRAQKLIISTLDSPLEHTIWNVDRKQLYVVKKMIGQIPDKRVKNHMLKQLALTFPPLYIGFCSTVHKLQGQTFTDIFVYDDIHPRSPFRLVYTAFSRGAENAYVYTD